MRDVPLQHISSRTDNWTAWTGTGRTKAVRYNPRGYWVSSTLDGLDGQLYLLLDRKNNKEEKESNRRSQICPSSPSSSAKNRCKPCAVRDTAGRTCASFARPEAVRAPVCPSRNTKLSANRALITVTTPNRRHP
jgi:hypothetical protein